MTPPLWLAIGLFWTALGSPASEPWFEDVTRRAGILDKHNRRVFKNPYAGIMEGYTALGASVAVADFDGDGDQDIFATDSSEDGRNHLYRNDGGWTFTDVAAEAGVAQGNDAGNASADALWFDYDGDSRIDLLVVRFGHNLLFRNRGDGTFEEVARKAGLHRYSNSITAIAFDYDRDGDLDLLVGHYFKPVDLFAPETVNFFPETFESADNGGGLTLYRNNRDGTFTDVTQRSGLRIGGWVLDVGHADADNDGDEDLYVACDFGTDRFFENTGDGRFADRTEGAIGIDTKKGMNVDWADYDNDGFLDIYVTNITDDYMREGNFLWRNNGDLTFADVSRETGTDDTGWGWAGKFFDFDHDGWLDLYVVNGWVSAGKTSYVPRIFEMIVAEYGKPDVDLSDVRKWPPMGEMTLSGYQRMRLFHSKRGELFRDEAPRHGLDSLQDGRGIALADFDSDGRIDLYVSNADAHPRLYRNVRPLGPNSHWIQFLLRGSRSNRFGVGAQVRVEAGGRKYLSFVNGGNGFASQSSMRVHFGLAANRRVDRVEVRWPSGVRQTLGPLAADRVYIIDEEAPRAQPLETGEPR